MSTRTRMMIRAAEERRSTAISVQALAGKPIEQTLGIILLILVPLLWLTNYVIDFYFALTALTVLGFLLAFIGLRSPVAGLFGIGILMSIDPVTRGYLYTGDSAPYNTLNYWLLIVMVLSIVVVLRLNDPHTRLLELFLILLGLQLLISTDVSKGIQEILEIITMFGFVIYFMRISMSKTVLFWLAMVLSVLSGVGGAVYNMQINDLPYLNPNQWAFFPLAAIFVICLALYKLKDDHSKTIILLLMFAVNYGWIFLSGSRGNMLSGLLCLLFAVWHTRRMAWTPVILVLGALVGFYITTQMNAQSTYALERIQLLFSEDSNMTRRTSGRSDLMKAGLKIFKENPLGIGTGSFRDQFSELDFRGRSKPSHSAWVTTLAENGIIGIVLLVAYIASFTIVGWKKRQEGLLALGLMISASFAVVFITKEFYGKALWFMAAGATVILHQKELLALLPGNIPERLDRRDINLMRSQVMPDSTSHEDSQDDQQSNNQFTNTNLRQ